MAFTNALGASRTRCQNLLPRRPATPLSPTPPQLKLTSYLLSFMVVTPTARWAQRASCHQSSASTSGAGRAGYPQLGTEGEQAAGERHH